MSDCELEDLAEYLADTEEKLTERGLEFNRNYWTSQWKQDTKADRLAYHESGQSFYKSDEQ